MFRCVMMSKIAVHFNFIYIICNDGEVDDDYDDDDDGDVDDDDDDTYITFVFV